MRVVTLCVAAASATVSEAVPPVRPLPVAPASGCTGSADTGTGSGQVPLALAGQAQTEAPSLSQAQVARASEFNKLEGRSRHNLSPQTTTGIGVGFKN